MNEHTDSIGGGRGDRNSKILIVTLAIAFMMVFSAPFLFTDGNVTDTDTALGASADQTYPMISAGNNHTLALKDDGTVWAWGSNVNRQLGDGTTTQRETPVQVLAPGGAVGVGPYLTDVIAISAGFNHSMALKADGTVYAWGYNGDGRLGDGTTTNSNIPVQVLAPGGAAGVGPYLTDVIAISAGRDHSMALNGDGTVYTWGRNDYGHLGIGSSDTSAHSTPVQVSGLTGAVAISAGGFHSMALKADGDVYAWGRNGNGRLGDGTTTQRETPVLVSDLTGVIAIYAGTHHSMALNANGDLYAWGYNGDGRLGDGTTTQRETPVQVLAPDGIASVGPYLTDVIAISADYSHSMASKADGTVYAWGSNGNGHLGIGSSDTDAHNTPVQVPGLTGAVAISAGYNYSMALKADGTVYAWGYNSYGQLGDGTTTQCETPVQTGLTKMDVRFRTPNGTVYVSGVTENSVMLNWAPATSLLTLPEQMKYYVYVSTSKFPSGPPSGTPVNSEALSDTFFEVTGLTAGTDHYFVVVVEDLAGDRIAYSQAEKMASSGDGILSPTVVMVIAVAAIVAIFIAVAFLFFRKP